MGLGVPHLDYQLPLRVQGSSTWGRVPDLRILGEELGTVPPDAQTRTGLKLSPLRP